jgi:hypothetical protein
MTTNQPRRMNRLAYLGLGALTLLAVAATASALPLGLSQNVATPAGSVSADYSDYAASTCISPATPALPALPAVPAVPAVPVPLPIGVPALPSAPAVSGAATVCADASENGIHASAAADAMGAHAETGADVDTSEQAKTVKETAGGLKGFFEGLGSAIKGWF